MLSIISLMPLKINNYVVNRDRGFMVLVSSVEKRKRRQPTDDAADTDDAVECDDKRLVPVVVER